MIELANAMRPARAAHIDTGVVTAVQAAEGTLTATVAGVSITIPYADPRPSTGDTVIITFTGSAALVTGRHGITPPVTPPPPDTPTTTAHSISITTAIPPIQTGTYRGGSWLSTGTMTQGDWGWGNGFGAAYYGEAITALDAAELTTTTTATLSMTRTRGGVFAAHAPTLHLLAGKTRSGAPVSLATAPGPPLAVDQSATWHLPEPWVEQLLAGTAGGIGINATGTAANYQNYASTPGQFVLAFTVTREELRDL